MTSLIFLAMLMQANPGTIVQQSWGRIKSQAFPPVRAEVSSALEAIRTVRGGDGLRQAPLRVFRTEDRRLVLHGILESNREALFVVDPVDGVQCGAALDDVRGVLWDPISGKVLWRVSKPGRLREELKWNWEAIARQLLIRTCQTTVGAATAQCITATIPAAPWSTAGCLLLGTAMMEICDQLPNIAQAIVNTPPVDGPVPGTGSCPGCKP